MIQKGQFVSILGDSMSTFEGCLPEGYPAYYSRQRRIETGVFSPEETWWGRVLAHFGAELLVNNSWSGSYVSMPPDCEIESYGSSDARTSGLSYDGILPDHIFVLIGTNDRGRGFSLDTIETAYHLMLQKLKQKYPKAVIWCLTLPVTTWTGNPWFTFPEKQNGVKMTAYCELIASAARAEGCSVIDLSKGRLVDTVDGLHPNYDGMLAIAEKVIAALEAV